jgi:hypothetical protein
MEAVYSVISQLLEKSNEEWDLLYEKLIPILEWNRKKLLEVDEKTISDTYCKNLERLINETTQETYSLL